MKILFNARCVLIGVTVHAHVRELAIYLPFVLLIIDLPRLVELPAWRCRGFA